MSETENVGSGRLDLRDYVVILRRRWRMFVFVFVAVLALALGYSFAQTPQYVASADVLLEPASVDVAATGSTELSSEEVATQVQVVTSQPVAQLVQDDLRLAVAPDLNDLVTVEAVGPSRIVRITARNSNARQSARIANSVARSYLAFRENESVRGFEQASANLESRQTEAQDDLNAVESQLPLIQDRQTKLELQSQRRSLLTTLGQLSTQIGLLQESLTASTAGGELLRAASTPSTPISPRPVLTGVLGGLLGLMLGIGAALLRDRFNDVVYDEETVRRALGGSVVLGRIPRWPDTPESRDRLVSLMAPHSLATEGFQRLAVNVRFLLATVRKSRESPVVTLVTSAQSSEGKTVTACNLAVTASRLGLRVVLIDADLRRAGAAARFGFGDPPGLSDLLVSDDSPDGYLIEVGVERLKFLPAGTIPPNPAALLSSARMRMVLAELAAEADLVVLDSPPLTAVADTLELAILADLVLVVAREGVSHRRDLVTVMESLRHVGTASISAVYNSSDDGGRKSDYYGSRERVTTPLDPAEGASASQTLDDELAQEDIHRDPQYSGAQGTSSLNGGKAKSPAGD